jgi:hypothetical protein
MTAKCSSAVAKTSASKTVPGTCPSGHLEALAKVWLYGNDRQIEQVSYREVVADEVNYNVTVRSM